MARQTQIRSIQDCLNDDEYKEINNNYPTLTVREALLILSHMHNYDNQNVNDLIELIKKKVLPTLQYFNVNMAKQNVRRAKVRGAKLTSIASDVDSSRPKREIGYAYKILADCYNYIGDTTNTIHYYTKAERCDINCTQQLNILSDNHPTPNLDKIVAKAKKIKGEHKAKNVAEYAYTIIDDILQLSVVSLSDDIYDNLKSMLSIYLRNEVDETRDNPPVSNLANAFEKMLKEFFYIPYAEYLDENKDKTDVALTCQKLRRKQIDRTGDSFTAFSNDFTLGKIKYLTIESIQQNGTWQIDQMFYDFITKYYHIDITQFTQEDFVELVKFTEFFSNSVRNSVQHGVVMHGQTFAHICEELLFKDNSWVRQIVKITNNEYIDESDDSSGDGSSDGEPSGLGGGSAGLGWVSSGGEPYSSSPSGNKSSFSLIARMNSVDRFEIRAFIEELQSFIKKNNRYPSNNSENKQEKILAKKVALVRLSSKGNNKLDLNERDIAMLDEINFVWDAKIDWFNDFYTSLLEFKNEYGTLRVSDDYVNDDGKHLGQQIKIMRKNYKKGTKLTNEQMQLLHNIDFEFNPQKENVKWFDDFYQELVEYKAVFGNFKNVIYDKILGHQVMSFVSLYQQQKLGKPTRYKITQEMIIKLRDIGFKFENTNNDEDIFSL